MGTAGLYRPNLAVLRWKRKRALSSPPPLQGVGHVQAALLGGKIMSVDTLSDICAWATRSGC